MYFIQEIMSVISKSFVMTMFLRLCIYRLYMLFGGLMIHFILPYNVMKYAFKFSLLGLNTINTTEPEFEEVNNEKIETFYSEESKGLFLFNHPSFLDTFVFPSVIDKDKIRPVAYGPYFGFPLNLFSDTFNPVYVQEGSTGISNVIKGIILTRKQNEPMIFMAPGGSDRNESQRIMSKFRSGAFLAKAPILPIVIRYSQNVNRWPIILGILKRLVYLTPVYFKIRVLDPIYPDPDESLEDFKNRVRQEMEKVPDYTDLHF